MMKNVMIVDDNCLTAEGIEKNIDWSALDATVIAVEYNSLSALDILKDTHVDLIISDIEMPDLDGISMSQKALEIQPFIKVILVSAYDKFEYAKRAIRLCVYDYIEKPLDYHYLTEKIKNAFTDIDRTQKNTELVKASRPVMTEKFFHDLLHYPGEDPATHLSQYLKYLDLRSDYDFFDVLILETEPDPAKSELDFTQYQIQLLNILNLVKEEMEIFDNVFYLKEFSGIVCIIGQNSKHPQHFLQVIHQVASTIVESCKNNVLSLNIGIGSLADSIWKLPVSFASASHSLKYLFFFPHKNIFDAREALGKELNLLSFSENTDETAVCPYCGAEISLHTVFCAGCGHDVTAMNRHRVVRRKICRFCGKPNKPEDKFCKYCFFDLRDGETVEFQLDYADAQDKNPKIKQAVLQAPTTEKLKICPNCGALNNFDSKFCFSCGLRLVTETPKVYCFVCGAENLADAAFCTSCRYPLGNKNHDEVAKGWKCECGEFNERDDKFCTGCGRPKPTDGDVRI